MNQPAFSKLFLLKNNDLIHMIIVIVAYLKSHFTATENRLGRHANDFPQSKREDIGDAVKDNSAGFDTRAVALNESEYFDFSAFAILADNG